MNTTVPLFQPRRPAFWLYCLLLTGGLHTAGMVAANGFMFMPPPPCKEPRHARKTTCRITPSSPTNA